jgi:hypothetical protein
MLSSISLIHLVLRGRYFASAPMRGPEIVIGGTSEAAIATRV